MADDLDPSELGTKAYWEEAYSNEIKNYNDHGDVGEVWFDESSGFRIIKWMNNSGVKKDESIVDLGTGNGMMLIELAGEGYSDLTGIDYSEVGVELAKKIAADQKYDISYKVVDLLSEESIGDLGKFKICHDKGTFDAISLMENATIHKTTYMKNVYNLMEEDGLFIITSCNFTEDELVEAFSKFFQKHVTIPTQAFRFGGKIGNIVTSLVFKKLK